MDRLRVPFFIVATVAIVAALCLETGASFFVKAGRADSETQDLMQKVAQENGISEEEWKHTADNSAKQDKAPGLGIPSLALLDSLVLFTVAMMGAALLIPERVQGKVQGVVTLVVSLLTLLGAWLMFMATMAALMLMVALITAAPFGTIAYLALFGTFPRATANVILTMSMTFKLGFAGCLVFAHPRFLQNKGLVLIVLTSLLANVLLSWLHGWAPIFLTSITDAVGALLVIVLAGIWAIFLLIGSVMSIAKAIV